MCENVYIFLCELHQFLILSKWARIFPKKLIFLITLIYYTWYLKSSGTNSITIITNLLWTHFVDTNLVLNDDLVFFIFIFICKKKTFYCCEIQFCSSINEVYKEFYFISLLFNFLSKIKKKIGIIYHQMISMNQGKVYSANINQTLQTLLLLTKCVQNRFFTIVFEFVYTSWVWPAYIYILCMIITIYDHIYIYTLYIYT